MKPLKIKDISKYMDGKLTCQDPEAIVKGVSIDSREVKMGDLFIPLKGENQDAHQFIPEAIKNGCACVVIGRNYEGALPKEFSNPKGEKVPFIICDDTLKGLQQLAKHYLATLKMKKIGVTGSTGKTTTKDMIYYICSEKYATQRNTGNFNNHIGLPLTVLSFEESSEVGILEMGMSEKGEIELLAELVRPDIGIITNIGTAHIENLGTREDIFEAKMEITKYFNKENILIVNRDNDLLDFDKGKLKYKLFSTGENGKSDLVISNIRDFGEKGISFTLEHKKDNEYESQEFELNIPGRHNAYNGALAVATGLMLGVTLKEASIGLSKMKITDKRLTIKGKDGVKIIDDTYNASVDSMKSGIDVLESVAGVRKIAVLGDMLEMGENSWKYHEEVGEYLATKQIDFLITVGKDSKYIAKGAAITLNEKQMMHFDNREKLSKKVKEILKPGDVVLIKGSRGMKLDKVVNYLMEG